MTNGKFTRLIYFSDTLFSLTLDCTEYKFFGQQLGQNDVIFTPKVKAKMIVFRLLCCSSIKLPFSTLLVSPGINECSTGSYVCDVNANCTNTDDSYICACKEGYTGDGHLCQGIIIAFDPENSRIKFLTDKKKNTLSINT